jgi:formylglycine-generating enzyme required for sulfatase activity
MEFCRLLSALPGEAGRVYRLPTEAEWEYACRAWGTAAMPFHLGFDLQRPDACFDWRVPYGRDVVREDTGPEHPFPVGQFRPNAWGLHDMHGNLDEWCADWFDQHYYEISPRQDPTGPAEGTMKVLRGGSFNDNAEWCRAAFRYRNERDSESLTVGFRVTCEWRR